MSAEDDVRAASERFYAALNSMANGDAGAMADIWARSAEVTAMHPIGGRQVGWDQVGESWRGVAAIASDGQVRLGDQVVRVIGDAAYETGTEQVSMKLGGHSVQSEVRVTNVYRREGGEWKIVHHHTDPSPELLAALDKL